MESIKSSPLKAAPNGFEPTSPEARAAVEAVVLDSYAWFKALVKDRRGMDDGQLAAVSDGRVFTGRQGVGLKLVDGLGNEKTALDWLAAEKHVPVNTPVRGLRPVRAGRCLTEKAPKPRNSTRSPLAMAAVISPRIALTMFSTSRW